MFDQLFFRSGALTRQLSAPVMSSTSRESGESQWGKVGSTQSGEREKEECPYEQ